MTPVSKNVYIDKVDDIVYKYINKFHITVDTKPADVKRGTYLLGKKTKKRP